jgi:hypothetical protein
VRWTGRGDLLLSVIIGIAGLLLFHLDHLLVSYSGWDDPAWLLHLFVDGSYVLVYGGMAWMVIRGWRLWRKAQRKQKNLER